MHAQRVPGLLLILVLSKAASAEPMVAMRVEVEPDPALMRLVSWAPPGTKPEKGSLLMDTFFDEVEADPNVIVVPRPVCDKAASKLAKPQFLLDSDQVLADFTASTDALYGVHVLVRLNFERGSGIPRTRVLKVKARVVRRDGQLMVPMREHSARLQQINSEILISEFRTLTHQLVGELALGGLPETIPAPSPAGPDPSTAASSKLGHGDEPEDEARPNQATTSPPHPQVTESQRVAASPQVDPGAGERLWGKVGVGAGLGVAAIGGVLWCLAASDFAQVQVAPNGSLEGADMVSRMQSGVAKKTAGIVVLAGGAAIAGVGAALWALAPKAPVSVTAAPLPSGIALSVGGTFK